MRTNKKDIYSWKTIFLTGIIFLALGVFYTIIFSAFARNADVVNGYLAGLDMGRGNWRLAHWHLSLDNFWLQDSLLYAIATRVFGNRPFLIVVVPALAWAALVVASWSLSRRKYPRENLMWSSAIIGVVLAFPVLRDNPIMVFIGVGSDHVVTTLQCVIMFIIFDVFVERGSKIALMAAIGLCIASVASDLFAIFIGVIPVAGACLFAADVKRYRRVEMLIGVIIAAILGKLLVSMNATHGGFQLITSLQSGFARFNLIGKHIAIMFEAILGFWGSDFFGLGEKSAIAHLLRVPLLGVACWVVYDCLWRTARAALRLRIAEIGFVDVALSMGIAVTLAACVFSKLLIGFWAGRYLLPVFVYMTILMARRTPRIESRSLMVIAAFLGVIVAANGYDWTLHPTLKLRRGIPKLTAWIADHNLTFGYAQYWTASPIRVESRGRILALQLVEKRGGVVPFIWNNRGDLYPRNLSSRKPFFVVVDPRGSPKGAYSQGDVRTTFGRPAKIAVVDGFTVDVYR